MTYTKPQLVGYSAIEAIQASSLFDKESDGNEAPHIPSVAAYEADE